MNVATIRKGRLTAALDDGGAWSSDSPPLARFLNSSFGPAAVPPSPSAGWNEFLGQARAAATALGARLEFTSAPAAAPDDGRVY